MINIPHFCIFTVPHSGTRFTMSYFQSLKMIAWNPSRKVDNVVYWQVHAGNDYIGRMTLDDYKRLHKLPVIVTVTHPYRNWVSFTGRGKSYDQNVDCWKYLINEIPKLNHYLFDINCRESERKTHLMNILHFLNLHNEEREALTNKWVDEWPTVRPMEYANKQKYLDSGELPSGYDYDQLQFAIDWYESLPTNDY